MSAHGYIRGREAVSDGDIWSWADNGEPCPGWSGGPERPCPQCGLTADTEQQPGLTLNPDPCIGDIPGASDVCCGHGRERGYIIWATADYVGLGPCAFCGFHDAGHRTWDAIAERIDAGESERSVAQDYDLSVQGVRALRRRSLLAAAGKEG